MWLVVLSDQLPVVALVSRYLTNKLIGRGPIPDRNSFITEPCGSAKVSGISSGFPGLSQSLGQVAHVLRTRSPLIAGPKSWSPFDLHVLSTPPAFVLSQDQTLRRDFRSPFARRLRGSLFIWKAGRLRAGTALADRFDPARISGRFQYYYPQVVLTRRTAPSPSDGKALAFVTLFSSQGAKGAGVSPRRGFWASRRGLSRSLMVAGRSCSSTST